MAGKVIACQKEHFFTIRGREMKRTGNSHNSLQDVHGTELPASKRPWIRKLLAQGILFSLIACCSTAARAELPPGAYEKLLGEAGEVVRIRITYVGPKTYDGFWGTDYTVTAKVLAVKRSKFGLRRGDTIRFALDLTARELNICGAAYRPLLKKNWTGQVYFKTPADLKRTDANLTAETLGSAVKREPQKFELAAYGRSFKAGPVNWALHGHRRPTGAQIRRSLP